MKETRIANKIIAILFRDRFYYPGRLAVDMIGVVARWGVLLMLYWYVFKLQGGVINGTSFTITAWSMFFYFSFSVLRLRDVSRLIMQDVQSGSVEVLFSKPVGYIWYRVWWQIGLGLGSFLVVAIIGPVVLSMLVGVPFTMKIGIFIPTLLIVFILGVVLSLLLYLLVGLMAFWVEDINPIFWVVDKTVMILGGSYLPVSMFPPLMYKIALYSPFGASQFITHTVYSSWDVVWLQHVAIQLVWILIFIVLVWLIFKRARQKVSINGG